MGAPLPPGVDDVSTAAGWFHYWAVTILTVAAAIGGVLWWLMRIVYHLGTRLSTNESMTAANSNALEKIEPRVARIESIVPDLSRRSDGDAFRSEISSRMDAFRKEVSDRFDALTALIVANVSRHSGGEKRD